MELIHQAIKATGDLPMFAYVAPELRQARTTMWPRLKFKLAKAIEAGVVEVMESDLSVRWKSNGAVIRLFGAADPDSLRGMTLDGVVIDEVAQMKTEAWEEVILPMLAAKSAWALFIGTPKGVNLFSLLFERAATTAGWWRKAWTCYETGALKPAEIENMRLSMSAARFAREMLCDFHSQSDEQLISMSLAMEASQRVFNPHDQVILSSPVVLGVDPARFGEDRSVIVRRQGLMVLSARSWKGIDTMHLAHLVAREIVDYSPTAVFIDVGGLGAGVVDRVRQLGHSVTEINFGGKALSTGFQNRRAEMWWNMRKWLESGGAIPNDPVLIRELATPLYWFTPKDEVALEAKDSIRERLGVDGGGSPDIADALALSFSAPVARQLDYLEQRLSASARQKERYHPFQGMRRGR